MGKSCAQVYLRRLVTMLALSGGLSANMEAGFHLPTYILKRDEEWLRLYNQIYHLMHLGCAASAFLSPLFVVDDQRPDWIRPNFPEKEIADF